MANSAVTIHDVLADFRRAARDNRDLGDKFESLIVAYFRTDPLYAERFSEIWFWSAWPYRHSITDLGIDLVAQERVTGEYVAIQCKFRDPAAFLPKEEIDSFLSATGKRFETPEGMQGFAAAIIVSTTDKWSRNAEAMLADRTPPISRLRVQDLAASPVDWSQFSLDRPSELRQRPKKTPWPHQQQALADIERGFAASDRGRLIMACGTGKTFLSLRVAEHMATGTRLVLFLVPSISLLSQTVREWTAEAQVPFHAFAVCSDTKVGRHNEDISVHDLALPATTDAARLADAVAAVQGGQTMTVIFSTYQSIQVLSDAQGLGMPDFDLIVCDEAHRTTGVVLQDEEESHFVRVHRQEFVRGNKRLYMTATPRIYADSAKTKAEEANAELCSMDDESKYGPIFHRLGFGEAVNRGLLSDYKVMVLAVDEKYISKALQRSIADENSEIRLDDAVKIVGCWNGLSKQFVADETQAEDPSPMRRAVAFSRSIADSKHIAEMFQRVVDEYLEQHGDSDAALRCEAAHVDGTFNVLARNEKLDWLRAGGGDNTCRILSNARCLSEGVDVPALDAVLFLNPRDSIVDVVQSVGRVMRLAPGKKYGYVILPIGVPAGVPPEEALQDNKKYRVVWQVLQALRAHDDRFNATVNKIELNKSRPDQIQVIGVGGGGSDEDDAKGPQQIALAIGDLDAWKAAIYARIVLKCGDRRYWESWAGDVAKIAERHIARIRALVESGTPEHKKAFERFLSGLRENINPSISEDEAIEMLSQHLITRPVFDALFEGYEFTRYNPVSRSMQDVLDVLEGQAIGKEVEALQGFYDSVRARVSGIDNAEGRQKVIVELYDKFFRLAFPKMAERLGIVYTPTEVVDFIIRSAEHALRTHFGVGLTDQGVHILDPFTGTGTFIARLLQSGLIRPEDLERKYRHELHANEIVLLAYYIAAINVEETYHGLAGGDYRPFEGIVLTDTFQLTEGKGGLDEVMFPENNTRARRQSAAKIQVIVCNPPYSEKQINENDNNKNLRYPALDERIRRTYAAVSAATRKGSVYDSYVRAIRWASDRINSQGVIGLVTNGSFIDARNMDGLRKCLMDEFSAIYCFNLRGNQRTSRELSRREGGKIFGSGSRAPIAITLLVKDPASNGPCRLQYHDIGDYLSREEKLATICDFGSIARMPWATVIPDDAGDWINQRHPEFEAHLPLGDKGGGSEVIVCSTYSRGVATDRDAWAYNFDQRTVEANMCRMIDTYNAEVDRYQAAIVRSGRQVPNIDMFVESDPRKISWTHNLKQDLAKGRKHSFDPSCIVASMYRPFCKERLYFNRRFNERVYQIPRLFPTPRHTNVVIVVQGIGVPKSFAAFMTDLVPDLNLQTADQCFPLYYYDTTTERGSFLREEGSESGYVRRDAITDQSLAMFQQHYQDASIAKEHVFYYVYGVLHAPEYRRRYESDLKKMLPRIPFAPDFWGFSKGGRALADLHLGYETVEPYPLAESSPELVLDPKAHYRVEKMVFPKNGKEADRTTIIYNSKVRLTGIPLEAYEYVVNGKPAIEWVMDRYAVAPDQDSGIRNDPNAWSDDPRYIVDLVKRIVRVSLETVRIVKGLPELGIGV